MAQRPVDERASRLLAGEAARLTSAGMIRRDDEERAHIHESHVRDLTALLMGPVRQALGAEAQELGVARTWVAEAELLGRWLALPDAPGTEEALRQASPLWDSLRSLFKWESAGTIVAAQAARDRVAGELVSALKSGDLPAPEEQEVVEHATELAQLLLSNWFAVLEHALQDAGRLTSLPLVDALPPQAKAEDLLEGCEAFALAPGECAKVLLDYQTQLVRRGGPITLSPSLHLRHSQQGWEVARPQSSNPQAWQDAFVGWAETLSATEEVGPWALARPLDLWGPRETPTYSAGAELDMVVTAVQCLRNDLETVLQAPIAHANPRAVDIFTEQVELDLTQVAHCEWQATRGTMPLNTVRAAALQAALDPTTVYRVALKAAVHILKYKGHAPTLAYPVRVHSLHVDPHLRNTVLLSANIAHRVLSEHGDALRESFVHGNRQSSSESNEWELG